MASSQSSESSPFAAAFDTSPCPAIVSGGPREHVLSVNEAARRLIGTPLGTSVRGAGLGLSESAYLAWERVARSGVGEVVDAAGVDERPGRFLHRRFGLVLTPWTDGAGDRGVVAHLEEVRNPELAVTGALLGALLPSSVPLLEGSDVAAGCVVGETAELVCGDWYDVVASGERTVSLVVGDVVGRGLAATAAMSGLRAVLSERLSSGAGVEEALGALDRWASTQPAARGATVCVAEVDLDSGRMRYATAGHPPPLVLEHGREPCLLPLNGSGPVGVGPSTPVAEVYLDDDDLVLLYTDGALRSGPVGAEDGLRFGADAAQAAAAASDPTASSDRGSIAQQVCDSLLSAACAGGRVVDDVALVVLRRDTIPPPLVVELEPVPGSVPRLRHLLAEWLEPLALSGADEFAIQHAVGEVVANAVQHPVGHAMADTAVLVTVEVRGGVVTATVEDPGPWKQRRQQAGIPEGGWGLGLARSLADELRIERSADGSRVVVAVRGTRPTTLYRPLQEVPDGRDADELKTWEAGPAHLMVGGVVDLVSSDRLRQVLLQRSRGGSAALTVDLSEVSLLDSSGVRVLQEAAGWRADLTPAVRLVASAGSPAQRVMETVGLPHQDRLERPPAPA